MKRPAYAHALIGARRAGRHPQLVTVIYGHDWHVPDGVTRLAVKPGCALGLDWACVAGLPVDVIDRRREADDDKELLQLAGEIARQAATVMVDSGGQRQAADVAAFLERIHARPPAWPAWWTQEIDQVNERNRRQWIAEAEAYLAQFAL